jgi:acetyltransferase-like isoleucine patch superfamily enzyme
VSDDRFIHDHALVESDSISPGTRVWAFAHVMPEAVIGAGCNIADHTYIEGDVVIGDRVTVKWGVYPRDGLRVEDDVFIGPQAMFTNDRFPRSRQPFEASVTTIRQGASVGAGAVVTKSVPEDVVVVGNPARVLRRLT